MLYLQRFTFNPVQENAYVLFNDQRECCIIDPGCYFAEEEAALTGFVAAEGLTPVLLLNTHCHFDHSFGNAFVHRTWGLPLQLHRLEEAVLAYGPASAARFGLQFQPFEGPLQYLEEGDTLTLGRERLTVLFAPGHSPGHLCFYCEEHSFLIGGDVLFQGSIGRTDLPGGSFEVLEQSIRTRLYTLPDAVTVHPGHGPATTIGREKRGNPFVQGE
ncbi:MAG TPA: MBL fold metallo-hydrolase [Chitinophagaceae bacterium]|jgi:glyoxylase-like metal-dependent hydrolase (beta-lactamase superfamily II)|nr:MBL fold metallo-hydrolase [Chitinophagaceae bacterium]